MNVGAMVDYNSIAEEKLEDLRAETPKTDVQLKKMKVYTG